MFVPDIIHEDVINLDVDKINFDDKEAMKELILQLLSTIEQLAQSNQKLRKDNQQLKDEINRLKGEKGRPRILPNNLITRLMRRGKNPKNGIKIARNKR